MFEKSVMFRRTLLVCFIGIFCWKFFSNPSVAYSQGSGGFVSSNPYIQRGLLFYNDQKYPRASQTFLQAYHWAKTKKKDRIIALKYLAFINVILGKRDKAHQYFIKLLQLNPKFRLDSAWDPPKFVVEFEAALKQFKEYRQVKIIILTPDTIPSNQPLILRIKVKDYLNQMSKLTLRYRLENTLRYLSQELTEDKEAQPSQQPAPRKAAPSKPASTKPASTKPASTKPASTKPASTKKAVAPKKPTAAPKATAKVTTSSPRSKGERYYTFRIPALLFASVPTGKAYYFEFYLTAYGPKGKIVASQGSTGKPLRIKRTYIKPKPRLPVGPVKPPIYKKAWFWAVVGTAVAGGTATALYFSLRTPSPPETGTATITIIR